ncbi:MAG TPA: ATP-binding protein [Solirubrobacteraceae bacterium]|nr:ATP-binding protein [Solirubrobacteraceae bacterium]
MAADIHDLIMQDLSLALANARMIAEASQPAGQAGVVVAAAERALAGAHEVVQGLARPQQSVAVVEAVEAGVRAAARNATLSFDAEGVPACDQPDRLTLDVLVHVGREAVTNAVKHSGSQAHVEVVFEHDEEWRLTVRDRGRGLGSADSTSTGFGLESMRARVNGLGGRLHVSDTAGKGTVVEAVLP